MSPVMKVLAGLAVTTALTSTVAAQGVLTEKNVSLALGGGLPIKVGNEVIGAVGISGSPGKGDVCSQAGIDKVADQLK